MYKSVNQCKRKSLLARLTMPLPELETYYRQRRAERFAKGAMVTHLRLRSRMHYVLLFFLWLGRILTGRRLQLLNPRIPQPKRPTIYACTHQAWDDVEMAFAAIRHPCWLFLGDPKSLYKSIDGLMLWLNGVICIDAGSRTDRHIGKETAVELLQKGGSLLIFPEGAWNMSENEPVMKLFTGTAEMAIRTGAQIVPLGFEWRGKTCYIRHGEAIDCAGMTLEQRDRVTEKLRDALATQKWLIWESLPAEKRSEIPEDMREKFYAAIEADGRGDVTIESILLTCYNDKKAVRQQEVFAHLKDLNPCRENAFLFRKL